MREGTKRSSDRTENGKSTNVTNRRSLVGLSTALHLTLKAGDSSKLSCFEELFVLACRSLLVERLERGFSIRWQQFNTMFHWVLLFQLHLHNLFLSFFLIHSPYTQVPRTTCISALKGNHSQQLNSTHISNLRGKIFCHWQLFQLYRKTRSNWRLSDGSQSRKAGKLNFVDDLFWELIAS